MSRLKTRNAKFLWTGGLVSPGRSELRASFVIQGSRAFTLMEMLLALSISAIVLAAVGGVFYNAIHLRERTTALLDQLTPVHQALAVLRRDLQGAIPPDRLMAGDFKSGAVSSGLAQGFGLQFCTTTGAIKENAPWGDVQQVTYELRDPTDRIRASGKDLVRIVGRNVLATTVQDGQEQWLLGNVQTLEFACYDGIDWRDSWDTSAGNTNLPFAVRVRLQVGTENLANTQNRQPLEMLVPLVCQSRTNQTQTAGGAQ